MVYFIDGYRKLALDRKLCNSDYEREENISWWSHVGRKSREVTKKKLSWQFRKYTRLDDAASTSWKQLLNPIVLHVFVILIGL